MSDVSELQVTADSTCFVCGSENPIGLKADFLTDVENCSSHTELILKAGYQGWQDVVHGGVLAALLDEACIYACRARAVHCVTTELQIRYRKPVPVDSRVTVIGQLTDSSKKIWLATAQLKIEDSLHAEATAKVFVLNR